jgi:hypothetical protein
MANAYVKIADVKCRACRGQHAAFLPSNDMKFGREFNFNCPTTGLLDSFELADFGIAPSEVTAIPDGGVLAWVIVE